MAPAHKAQVSPILAPLAWVRKASGVRGGRRRSNKLFLKYRIRVRLNQVPRATRRRRANRSRRGGENRQFRLQAVGNKRNHQGKSLEKFGNLWKKLGISLEKFGNRRTYTHPASSRRAADRGARKSSRSRSRIGDRHWRADALGTSERFLPRVRAFLPGRRATARSSLSPAARRRSQSWKQATFGRSSSARGATK